MQPPADGNAAAPKVRLLMVPRLRSSVPADMVERFGVHMTVPDWRGDAKRQPRAKLHVARGLVRGGCGSRRVEMVVNGTERR